MLKSKVGENAAAAGNVSALRWRWWQSRRCILLIYKLPVQLRRCSWWWPGVFTVGGVRVMLWCGVVSCDVGASNDKRLYSSAAPRSAVQGRDWLFDS